MMWKQFMVRLTIFLMMGFVSVGHAVDLLQIYQQAEEHDMTYQAAKATYEASQYDEPINLGPLLPQLKLTGEASYNHEKPNVGGAESYHKYQYTLTLQQAVFNFGQSKAYAQSRLSVKQAALTLALAQQKLVQSVAEAYFQVLLAEDQLKSAEQNAVSLQKQLEQTEQQYKVGVKAYTDVESTKASYESAVAEEVSQRNTLDDALEELAVITGKPEKNIVHLEDDFPLIKPDPESEGEWVVHGIQNNLQLQIDEMTAKIDKAQIYVVAGGGASDSTVPGFLPTVNLVGTFDGVDDRSNSYGHVRTITGALALEWDVFNGGETYATMKQDRYDYHASVDNAELTRRNTISDIRQNYLNVLSDISQVKAQKQAVISGESALEATRAAYDVGTRTIVDVLTEQRNLLRSQQNYAQAVYQYISDSLALKLAAGSLSVLDIVAINQWLRDEGRHLH